MSHLGHPVTGCIVTGCNWDIFSNWPVERLSLFSSQIGQVVNVYSADNSNKQYLFLSLPVFYFPQAAYNNVTNHI